MSAVTQPPSLRLQFTQRMIDAILAGDKTQTRRRPRSVPLKPGDLVWIARGRFGRRSESPATLRVLSVRQQRLTAISDGDAKREGFASVAEFTSYWDDLYDQWREMQVAANPLVDVIEFELVRKENTPMTTDFKELPIESLVPHPDNPRFELTGEALDSLAKSLTEVGLLQNLVCRTHPKHREKYEVLCGHRRLAAAKKAGIERLRCAVRELGDADALALMVTENLQREDLHPLEQAAGIERLLTSGMPIETVADRLGKSPAWVAKRRQLSSLTKDWKAAISNPKLAVSLMPARQLELIARLPESVQQEALNEFKRCKAEDGAVPKWQFDQFMGDTMRVLSAAPWSIDDAGLVTNAGPCSTCQKRSSQAPLLFEDLAPKRGGAADRCLDSACWATKHAALVQVRLAEARREHSNVVLYEDLSDDNDIVADKIVDSTDAKVARKYEGHELCKSGKNGAEPAIRMSDGQLIWLRSTRTSGSGAGAATKPKPKSAAKVREGRRAAFIVGKVSDGICKIARSKEAAAELEKADQERRVLMALLLAFGTQPQGRLEDADDWRNFDSVLKSKHDKNVIAFIQQFADAHWVDFPSLGHAHAIEVLPQAMRAADIFRLDFAGFEAEAAKKFPDPQGKVTKAKPKASSKRARAKKPAKAKK